jgi:hypothetical protein
MMKRLLMLLVASLGLLLTAGVGTAWAGGVPGGLPAGQSQSIDQSQTATNSIDQTANSQSVAVNASPNVAIANSGSVDQSSDASSGAVAVNKNESEQSNTLSNEAEQSQSGASADKNHGPCCERTSKRAGSQTQSTDQSQNASNSISQDAQAKSAAVNASPNVAVLNKGGDCNCGGGVRQSSNASSAAVAVNKNDSQQSNALQNDAGQSQAGGQGGKWSGKRSGPSQSIAQDQTASNSIDQTAKAHSAAVNASPNVAVLNFGPVDQSSNASSEAVALNKNESQQSNTLQNDAGQSQAGGGSDSKCCRSAPQSQDVTQEQSASNSISQTAESKSVALNVSPNVAILNFGGGCGECGEGGVHQSSGAWSGAFAGNRNAAEQSNDLSQDADQAQEGSGSGSGGGGEQSQTIDQTQNASNSIDQTAAARSYAINASPNVAVLNFGPVDQQSNASSEAFAVNKNRSSQSNTLNQGAEQRQSGDWCCGNSCKKERSWD